MEDDFRKSLQTGRVPCDLDVIFQLKGPID